MSVITAVIAWLVIGLFVFALVSVLVRKKMPRGIREEPLPEYEDPDLGPMKWSRDDEAWLGDCCGLKFGLNYEGKSTPTRQLLSYAKEVLSDPTWLASTLQEEKKNWASKIPSSAKGELAALTFGLIYFSMLEDQGHIYATVDGGGDCRSWRIEYHGRTCDGLGFDT